ncbi:hypothetical protein Hanom_Chr14g01328491 [Helianthus anomalus]
MIAGIDCFPAGDLIGEWRNRSPNRSSYTPLVNLLQVLSSFVRYEHKKYMLK